MASDMEDQALLKGRAAAVERSDEALAQLLKTRSIVNRDVAKIGPVLEAIGVTGLESLVNKYKELDPAETPKWSSQQAGKLVIDLRNAAGERIDEEPFGVLKMDGCVRALPRIDVFPASCLSGGFRETGALGHLCYLDGGQGEGAWRVCSRAAGGCGGSYCTACSAPHAATPCRWGGDCRHTDADLAGILTEDSADPFVPRRAAFAMKVFTDGVRDLWPIVKAEMMALERSFLTPSTSKTVSFLGDPPGAPTAARYEGFTMSAALDCIKAQNNGQALPTEERPAPHLFNAVDETINLDPPSLPKLALMDPRIAEEPVPARHKLLRYFCECFMALILRCCAQMGSPALRYLTTRNDCDTVNARAKGADELMRVGAVFVTCMAFCRQVTHFCEDNQADPGQTRRLLKLIWDTKLSKAIENSRCSITHACNTASASGYELPAKEPVKPKAGGTSGGKAKAPPTASTSKRPVELSSDSDSDSGSDAPPRRKKKKKSGKDHEKRSKDKGKKKAKKSSPKSSSDESSDEEWDPEWGGSKTSKLACFAELKELGTCKKGKKCDFSHRPGVIAKEKKKRKQRDRDEE